MVTMSGLFAKSNPGKEVFEKLIKGSGFFYLKEYHQKDKLPFELSSCVTLKGRVIFFSLINGAKTDVSAFILDKEFTEMVKTTFIEEGIDKKIRLEMSYFFIEEDDTAEGTIKEFLAKLTKLQDVYEKSLSIEFFKKNELKLKEIAELALSEYAILEK